MEKSDLILAAFAAAGGSVLTPVKAQKLLFLIDRKIPHLVGGPIFDFKPYHYGPFDSTVYSTLEELAREGFVEIIEQPNLNWNKYRLTHEGMDKGQLVLDSLGDSASGYIRALADFVKQLSFSELVGAIYSAFPEMRVNSVFSE